MPSFAQSKPASTLNPYAMEFYPAMYYEDEVTEEFLSYEELDELEATENWVLAMAEIEELEQNHVMELALMYAPSCATCIPAPRVARAVAIGGRGFPAPVARPSAARMGREDTPLTRPTPTQACGAFGDPPGGEARARCLRPRGPEGGKHYKALPWAFAGHMCWHGGAVEGVGALITEPVE
mmetsp:Transcript_20941/g.66341  ORF Transcript_20941/g.66341 Transcript_20941/m.66341 type:complete len:181 (-) Transcript_20941:85-627(-)